MVDNDALREAVLRSDMSLSAICRELGWMRVTADTNRLRRTLGMSRTVKGLQSNLSDECAQRLADILGLDPVDVGL